MDVNSFRKIENYMLSCMEDSAHDKEHIYRVLYNALEIAKSEADVNYDILIVASLLHDIGRKEQFENPNLCHAMVGGDKAYRFLLENGFAEEFSSQVENVFKATDIEKLMNRKALKQKFCLMQINWMRQERWVLPEHWYIKVQFLNRYTRYFRMEWFQVAKVTNYHPFFRSISIS